MSQDCDCPSHIVIVIAQKNKILGCPCCNGFKRKCNRLAKVSFIIDATEPVSIKHFTNLPAILTVM